MKRSIVLLYVAIMCIAMTRAQTLYEVTTSTDILNAPNLNSTVIGTANQHDIVAVTAINNGWATVTTDYCNGYIEADCLNALDDNNSGVSAALAATVIEPLNDLPTLKAGTKILIKFPKIRLNPNRLNEDMPFEGIELAQDIKVDGHVVAGNGSRVQAHWEQLEFKRFVTKIFKRGVCMLDGINLTNNRIIRFATEEVANDKDGYNIITKIEFVHKGKKFDLVNVFVAEDVTFPELVQSM